VQWGIISTSTINTMQLVLILLLAKDNPLWLPVAIVGHVQISRILERYGPRFHTTWPTWDSPMLSDASKQS